MIVFGTEDSGPAQYMSDVINSNLFKFEFNCFSSENSKKTFTRNKIKSTFFDLKKIPISTSLVITGSPPNKNNLDYELIKWANKNFVKSILLIEHWTNLKERIVFFSEPFFPYEIWVNDNWCKEQLLKLNVSSRKISVVGNPVLEKITKRNKKPATDFNQLIFISEEMKSDFINLKDNYGFDEFEVIQFILNHKPNDLSVAIKLHPSEKVLKYNSILDQHNVKIVNVVKDDLPSSACYIGMNSILLLELALKGEKVYTFRPNAKTKFIGNELGLTFDLNEDKLIELVTSKKHLDFDIPTLDFKGSIKKINHRIMELI